MIQIVAISDGRKSNDRQVSFIQNALCSMNEVLDSAILVTVKLRFTPFIVLPNFLLKYCPWIAVRVNIPINLCLSVQDILISCGRRSALASLYIAKKYGQKNCHKVQILNPNLSYSNFSAIVLPKHDKFNINNPKIVPIIGGLSNFTKEEMDMEIKKYSSIIGNFQSRKISVNIGGSSKHAKISDSAIVDFTNKLNELAKNMDCALLISTSRRTDKKLIQYLKDNLECSYYLYEYGYLKKSNPYIAFLASCDYTIVTSDSISMICDACNIGKNVYIYDMNMNVSKYNSFFKDIQSSFGIKTMNNVNCLENIKKFELNNAHDIADRIYKVLVLK